MLDHLIFNKLKWFNVADNAQSTTINGRKYLACPKSFVFKDSDNSMEQENGNPYTTCLGISRDNEMWYRDASGQFSAVSMTSSDVKNINWGGNSPLSHVYQWFRALVTRRVVIL